MRQALLTPPTLVQGAPLSTLPSIVYNLTPGSFDGIGSATGAGTLLAVPMKFLVNCTLDLIAVDVTVGGASNFHMGLYRDNGSRTYPGALIVDSGSISAAAAGLKQFALAPTVKVAAGEIIWTVVTISAAAATFLCMTNATATTSVFMGLTNDVAATALTVPFVFAALPASYPAGATLAVFSIPAVFQRVLSVP